MTGTRENKKKGSAELKSGFAMNWVDGTWVDSDKRTESFEAVEGECAANDQPGEQVNRRGIDQRQEIREPEKAACRPTPAQCSKWDAEQQAGAQRSETRTPHGELAECCGFVMAVNRKGICAPAKDTKKKQEDR